MSQIAVFTQTENENINIMGNYKTAKIKIEKETKNTICQANVNAH